MTFGYIEITRLEVLKELSICSCNHFLLCSIWSTLGILLALWFEYFLCAVWNQRIEGEVAPLHFSCAFTEVSLSWYEAIARWRDKLASLRVIEVLSLDKVSCIYVKDDVVLEGIVHQSQSEIIYNL